MEPKDFDKLLAKPNLGEYERSVLRQLREQKALELAPKPYQLGSYGADGEWIPSAPPLKAPLAQTSMLGKLRQRLRTKLLKVKQFIVNWALAGVHIQGATFGVNSITLSPAGVGDLARWTTSQAAAQLGDLGMDITTGRPSCFVNGAAQPVSNLLDLSRYGPFYHHPDFVQAGDIVRVFTASVTGASNANPAVITAASTAGLQNADVVLITGVTGNTAVNGLWQISALTGTTFTLPIAGNGAYGGGGTITAAQLDVSLAYNRMFANTQPGQDSSKFALIGGTVVQDDVFHTASRLIDLKVTTNIVTGFIWGSTSINWQWPSTIGMNGVHVRVQGPGSAGVITLKDPAATHVQKWIISSFHGACELRGFTFTGDPTLNNTTADTDSVITVSGFWTTTIEHNQFYGILGTNNILAATGNTGGNIWTENHFSSCGLNNAGGDQTKGIWQISGSEGGTLIARNVFLTGQIPGYAPGGKATGTSPAIALAEEESAGTPTGTGYIFEQNFFADPYSAAIAMQPIAVGSKIGHVTVRHCYFFQNTTNATGNGCINTAGSNQVISLNVEHCLFNLNNGTANPAINVPSATNMTLFHMRDCEVDLNFHVTVAATQEIVIDACTGGVYVLSGVSNLCDHCFIIGTNPGADTISGVANVGIKLLGLPTTKINGCNLSANSALLSIGANVGRVFVEELVVSPLVGASSSLDVSIAKPLLLKERFQGNYSTYMTDSGAGFSVNQLIMIAATGPTVKTATTAAVAQDIVGIAGATVAGNGYGPVLDLNQHGLTVINDGVGALTAGTKIAPSTTTAGRVVAAAAATNSIGVVETNIAAAAGSTGTIYANAA
jgi:hypothetical protein